MSGLFGIIDLAGKTDIGGFLERAGQALSHLSWYTTDSWKDPDVPIGLGRSGIGIFNPEPQPVLSKDGQRVLFMAGELYRTGSLRTRLEAMQIVPRNLSHPELVLCAYEAFGDDFAKMLDGAFVVIIYDRAKHCLKLVNDRLGLYPTYIYYEKGRLVFGPEVKSVLAAPFVPKRMSVSAVAQYFRFQHLLEDRTFHEDIWRLPYANIGEFDLNTGHWKLRRYWDWDDIPQHLDMTFDEAVEEGGRVLRNTIRELSSDHMRAGVFLSGGLDSRTIIGLLTQFQSAPVTATFGAQNSRDVYYAERIAREVGSKHHWFEFSDGRWVLDNVDLHLALTEGFHHWVHMHGITMLPKLRGMVDFNLTGWDGGTVMGHVEQIHPSLNHPPDDNAILTELYQAFTRSYTWPGLTEAEERLVYTPEFGKQAVGLAFDTMQEEFKRYAKYRQDNRAEYFYVRNHCFRLTQNMVTFIRSHIEVRFPFWDYPLLNFIYSLKPEIRGHQILYRHIITREMPQLATIPYDKQEFLPTTDPLRHKFQALSVRLRRRLGVYPNRPTLYADYENYLRNELRQWAESILFDPRTEARGILNMPYVRSLMKRHMSGQEEWTIGKIAPLITFEMMARNYLD